MGKFLKRENRLIESHLAHHLNGLFVVCKQGNLTNSFQQLLDRIDDLLKKITFNNELIETFDTFFKNQSSTAQELRYVLSIHSQDRD